MYSDVSIKLVLHINKGDKTQCASPTLTNLVSFTCHWTEHVWVMARKLLVVKDLSEEKIN